METQQEQFDDPPLCSPPSSDGEDTEEEEEKAAQVDRLLPAKEDKDNQEPHQSSSLQRTPSLEIPAAEPAAAAVADDPPPLAIKRNNLQPRRVNTPKRTSSIGEVVAAIDSPRDFEKEEEKETNNTPSFPAPTATMKSDKKDHRRPPPIMLAPVLRTGAASPPPALETMIPTATHDGSRDSSYQSDYAIVTPLQDNHDDDDGSNSNNNPDHKLPERDLEVGRVLSVAKSERGLYVYGDIDDVDGDGFPKIAAQIVFSPKGDNHSSSTEHEEGTSSSDHPQDDNYKKLDSLLDGGGDGDDDGAESKIATRKATTTAMILLQFLGCCILTILLVGGSAAAATYFLVFHEGDPPTMTPTISIAPTMSAVPSAAPSATPSVVPSASPSFTPTLSTAPSTMPSSSPTPDFRSAVENFLRSNYRIDVVRDGGIVGMAADWVIVDKLQSGTDTYDLDTSLLQRFALVALELSLGDVATAVASSEARQSSSLPKTSIATRSVNECDWEGVSCNDNGQVVQVDWAQRKWSGQLPGSLRLMRHLKVLNLSDNDITGTIPESLYAMVSLERLYLYKNNLSGTISTRIGLLKKLTHWHVSENNLKGQIPEQLKSSDGIRPLEYFNVYSNKLSGPIPNPLRLRFLKFFDIGRNQFTGQLPNDIGESCVDLRHLFMDNNMFRGTIPLSYNSVGNGRLESLTLHSNQLTGVVPGERKLYNNLQLLTLHENKFTSIDSANCKMIIPWGEMPEFKADCDVCQCDDYFNLCDRFCGRVA